MNIAIFTDSYYPDINGVSTASQTLYKSLKEKGNKVYVVTNTNKKKVLIEDDIIRIPGITIKSFYDYKFAWLFNMKVFKMLKKLNLDIIHIQTEIGIGLFGRIVAKKLNIPLIYTYHTMYEDYTYYVSKNNAFIDKLTKKLLNSVTRIFIDSTTGITTPSEKTKNALLRYGVTKYIHVVPNGTDFSLFDIENYSKDKFKEIKDEYNLHNKTVLLQLGRLAKEKSIDKILYSLSKYIKDPNTDKNVVLLIVGLGPAEKELKELTKNLNLQNYVIFVGKIPHEEVAFYYHIADIFLSASTSETQGLTYLEAMSCNCLVLCQYDFNLRQVIIDNKTGFYFYDYESFISRLTYLINLPKEKKEQIIKDGKENVYKLYSTEKFGDKMLKVYEKAIRDKW